MSRSGYSDDLDRGTLNLWRANVDRAINGKRGQAFLREMAEALDAMPVKELVADETVRDSEHVCAMGSVIVARGLHSEIDLAELDDMSARDVGDKLGIAGAMAQEIAFMNDDDFGRSKETPAERWTRMRRWVKANIKKGDGGR